MTRNKALDMPIEESVAFLERQGAVYYLAHPVAADEKMTFAQNLESIKNYTRILRECGIIALPTYYVDLLVFDDNDEAQREAGFVANVAVLQSLRNIVLCGHKLSKGMARELDAVPEGGKVINLVGMTEEQIRALLILR